jgi:hypothetical protein
MHGFMGPYGNQWFRGTRPYFIGGLLALPVFMLFLYLIRGFADPVEAPQEEPELRVQGEYTRIVIVEGCEYVAEVRDEEGLVHRGLVHRTRCRNPLHHPGMMSDFGFDLDPEEPVKSDTTGEM